jgi:hypothetical protein
MDLVPLRSNEISEHSRHFLSPAAQLRFPVILSPSLLSRIFFPVIGHWQNASEALKNPENTALYAEPAIQ